MKSILSAFAGALLLSGCVIIEGDGEPRIIERETLIEVEQAEPIDLNPLDLQ